MKKKSLHLACWNINGYKIKGFNKYTDPEFIRELSNKDIVCLLETHCPFQESLDIPNFRCIHLIRPKNKKTNKISGGISVFVKSELRQGIKFLEHNSNDYIWLQLCSNFFGLNTDIYLCFLYNPPDNSSYTQSLENDLFELIENDITNYSQKGDVIIMGDLNSRTGCESDFIADEDNDPNIPLFENHTPDSNLQRYHYFTKRQGSK